MIANKYSQTPEQIFFRYIKSLGKYYVYNYIYIIIYVYSMNLSVNYIYNLSFVWICLYSYIENFIYYKYYIFYLFIYYIYNCTVGIIPLSGTTNPIHMTEDLVVTNDNNFKLTSDEFDSINNLLFK